MKMRIKVDKLQTTKCVYVVDAKTIDDAQKMIRDNKVAPQKEVPQKNHEFTNFCVEVMQSFLLESPGLASGDFLLYN